MGNSIIGVIVTRTHESSQAAREEKRDKECQEQMRRMNLLADSFSTLDLDGNGVLRKAEMEAAIAAGLEPSLVDALVALNLPKGCTIADLFNMVDKDSNGVLTKDEFLSGMHNIYSTNDFQRHCLIRLYL